MKKHPSVHCKENSVNLAVKDVKFGFDTDWCRDKANDSLYVNLCYVNHYIRYLVIIRILSVFNRAGLVVKFKGSVPATTASK